jgi:hypothetical protein
VSGPSGICAAQSVADAVSQKVRIEKVFIGKPSLGLRDKTTLKREIYPSEVGFKEALGSAVDVLICPTR